MGIKKHIPNSITCCNLISGCIATTFAFAGDAKMALLWIIIGAVFDFFDGMSARLLHVSSPIGKELDSLADDVTFGVAPATILFSELSVLEYPGVLFGIKDYIPYVAFLMAAFSALQSSISMKDKPLHSSVCPHQPTHCSGVHSLSAILHGSKARLIPYSSS